MKIKNLEVSDTGNEMICNGFLITEIETFDQLINAYDEYSRKFPGDSILVSLDNLGQAQYTSMHSTMFHDLDDIEGHDLSSIDPNAFEEGEHVGYLSTISEFFIRENNFKSNLKDVTFLDACSRGLELDDVELSLMEEIHASPKLVLDERVVMLVVPVREPSLALCACPNGYFSSDLNPFENYALAAYLNERYG